MNKYKKILLKGFFHFLSEYTAKHPVKGERGRDTGDQQMQTHSFMNKNSHSTAHSQVTTDGEKSTQMGICLSACDLAVMFVSTSHLCPLLLCKA